MVLPARLAIALLLFLAAGEDVLAPRGEKAVVLLFVRTDCPISNRYAPELERLAHAFPEMRFYLVYTESGATIESLERHGKEYGYTIPFVIDTRRQYVGRTHVRVTPEAAVIVKGRLVYRGRIDDRFVDLGKTRPKALHNDLQDVLAAVSAGANLAFRETRAIGCAIEELP
jgi:hypothetical protein